MNILFITSTKSVDAPYRDPSVRYRCYGPAEILRQKGHNAEVCAISAFKPGYAKVYDAFVFHRPKWDASFKTALAAIRAEGKWVAADVDDLLFDMEEVACSPQVLNGYASLASVRKSHQAYHDALQAFDLVSVSTAALATKVAQVSRNAIVRVSPNTLSRTWVEAGNQGPTRALGPFAIGYFSGTRSHDNDLALWGDALHQVLDQTPEASLVLVGPIKLPASLTGIRPAQIKTLPAVPYAQLPSLIRACKLTIAPLAPTAFNECKSAIKYLESAAFGTPVAASEIGEFRRFEESPGLSLIANPVDAAAEISACLARSEGPLNSAMLVPENDENWLAGGQLVDWVLQCPC